ncbi:MAG: lytic transglycosylase domain-containing protein [Acidimicrobiales bacterium]
MLGGLRELVPRRRALLVAAAPVVAGVVGTAFLIPSGAIPPSHAATLNAVTHRASGNSITPGYLRSLPHDEAANVGRALFVQRPPSSLAGLALASAAIPGIAVKAYEHASKVLALTDPACHLSWADIAGIGRVESDNGLTWGSRARVSPNGTLTPPILGPLLDGADGLPAYPTPDHGILEHGGVWERAVGPMQFLPSTWLEYAQDGNGDHVKSPQNFWDAALTTAVFLCANGGDVASQRGFDNAVLSYNNSESYLSLVRDWVGYYEKAGVTELLHAGSKLLPVGVSTFDPFGGSHGNRPDPAAAGALIDLLLGKAVAVTEAQSTFSLSFGARDGGTTGASIATGTAVVNEVKRDAQMSVRVPGFGVFDLLEFASSGTPIVFVALPSSLADPLGVTGGEYLQFSRALESALPSPVTAGLSFAAADLMWSIDALDGATAAMKQSGRATIAGASMTSYSGPIDLSAASDRVPAAKDEFRELAYLLDTQLVEMTAWVGSDGFVHQLDIALPELRGAYSTAISLDVRLSGFGLPVTIEAPVVGSFPPTSSTTTTTTSTTTSTTSSPTSTTTSSPGTTTTTSPAVAP